MNRFKSITFKVLDLLVIFTMIFGTPMSALAADSPTGASIASDLADYPPGATVTLTGLGWADSETVHILVNDDAGQTWSHEADVQAGMDGSFIYPFDLPSWFVANYSVTATGPTSGTATTSFTDLAIGTYDQCANDDGDGYGGDPGACDWINGNLQGNNSTYNEGDATVQRLHLTDLVPGTSHTVTFKYGTTKGGKHAYDYLTTWDWSEDWITLADLCDTIAGCTIASQMQFPIPDDPNVPNSIEPAGPDGREMTIAGGTITAISAPTIVSGTYAGDSETVITVTYTVGPNNGSLCSTNGNVTTCGVMFWFGAHVAMTAQWTAHDGTTGASTISGSPYHVALDAVDGAAVGQRDNQMQSGAVPVNGTIVIIKDAVPDDAQDFSFNINNGSTFSQNFTLDDDAGADNTYPNSMSFSLPAGTYTAAELNIPGGWQLTNLACQVTGSNGSTTSVNLGDAQATINLVTSFSSSDTVTCTFTDSKIVNQNLTVTKTATPSLGRTYNWLIDKEAEDTQIEIAEGGTATFNYTVTVTPKGFSDTGWAVNGEITVTNPNAFDVAGVNVTDSIDNGGSCTVTNGMNVTVPANDDVVLDYSCTYASEPTSMTGLNTAEATWDKDAYYTPLGSASGTAGVDFGTATVAETNRVITVVDDQTDPSNPVTLGTSDYFNGPFEFNYSLQKTGVAGACTDYTNTAVIDETDQSDSVTVTVCVGSDLIVEKTVTASYNRLYKWLIAKEAEDTQIEIAEGGTATFNYDVTVTPDGVTDSGHTLSGTITVTNPNNWQAITADVTDALNQGGTCTVTGGEDVVIPAGQSVVLDYSCGVSDISATENTATATWDAALYFTPNGSASDSEAVTFALGTEMDKVITVIDDKTDPGNPVELGTWDWDDGPHTFEYTLEKDGVPGTCTDYTNTAIIEETGQEAEETVTVCVGVNLTVSKTAEGSKDRLYKWLIAKEADQTEVNIAEGGTATFIYTIKVTPNGYEDSDYTLGGTITVTNPNDWQDITLTSLTDTLDQGGSCIITEPSPYVVPRKTGGVDGTLTVHYTCTTDGTTTENTATATWDKAAYFTPNDSAFDDADVSFDIGGETDKIITVTDDNATPADPSDDQLFGPFDWDDGEATFGYSRITGGVAGTCTDYTNTAVIDQTDQEAEETVTVCVGSDLTVTKTASGTFDRKYFWEIFKNADDTEVSIGEGGSHTFMYTVDVNQTGIEDSAWEVHGTITITNPNDWQAITLTGLSDVVDNGGTCTVDPGPYEVAASDFIEVAYSCSFAAQPASYSGTNTATATWNTTLYSTPTGSASDDAPFTLAQDGSNNKTITVTDTHAGDLGDVTANDEAPFASDSFSYERTESGEPGTCTTYDNTATITQTGQSADEQVELCVGVDLVVTKTVETSYTRTFTWAIEKLVDQTKVTLVGPSPQDAVFEYTLRITHDDGTDSAWLVQGEITVQNPNDWQDIDAVVSDLVNIGGGASCTVEGEAAHSVTIPAGSSVTLDYVCTFTSQPDYTGLNTATADWTSDADAVTPSDSTTGTANIDFGDPTTLVDESVDVTDTFQGIIGKLTYEAVSPTDHVYTRNIEGISGECQEFDNTATIITNDTGTIDSSSVTVEVCSSLVSVVKMADGTPADATDPPFSFRIYTGPDGFDSGTLLVSDNTPPALLDFASYNLDPAETYTLCEVSVPAGWTSMWKVDTDNDGIADTVINPYNPNADDVPMEDLGNRCVDFGAGTDIPLVEGDTLVFEVDNSFPGGEPRTPGYWKNWNACTNGGQYDNAMAQGGGAGGFWTLDELLNNPGFLIGDMYLDGDYLNDPYKFDSLNHNDCVEAVRILDKSDAKLNRKKANDAAYELATMLLAAKLNLAAGAETCQAVQTAVNDGQSLLANSPINFTGTGDYLGSRVRGALVTLRNQALQLARTLDLYNNGLLCSP